MAILYRSLLLLLMTFLVVFVDRLTWHYKASDLLSDWLFFIIPFAVVAAGYVIGWLGAMIIQYSKWVKSFYLLGLNTAGIVLIIFVIYTDFQPWQEDLYKISHPSGKFTFKDFDGLKGHDIARGFDKFYHSLPSDTKINHLGYLFTKETIPGKASDTSWILFYAYRIYPDSLTNWISKVELHNGRYRVLANKQPVFSDSTYCRLAREYNEDKLEKLKWMIEEMPGFAKEFNVDSNSLKLQAVKQLRDTFPR